MSFADLGLSPRLLDAVARSGYVAPTPIQAQAIPIALAGRDLIVSSQTGSGKSAAFILPTLQRLIDRPAAKRAGTGGSRIDPRTHAGTRGADHRLHPLLRPIHQPAIDGHLWWCEPVRPGESPAAWRRFDRGDPRSTRGPAPARLGPAGSGGSSNSRRSRSDVGHGISSGSAADHRSIAGQAQTLLFSATIPPTIARLTSQIMSRPHTLSLVPTRTEAARIEEQVYLTEKAQKSRLLIELIGHQQVTHNRVHSHETWSRPVGEGIASPRHSCLCVSWQ